MLAYRYDVETKEFLGTQIAQIDPLEGGYLLPASCTFKPAPTYSEGQIPVFENEWVVKTDHRKKWQVKLADITFSKVDYIGEALLGYQFISDEVYDNYQADNDRYKVIDDVFTDIIGTPEYLAIKTNRRKTSFENTFLTLDTNKNYRLVPRGYANAQQSIDTVNNMVNVAGGLTQEIANMVLFYETPDFTKPEQCTEEWLIQHQYSAEPMTKEQWVLFYVDFTTKYAQKMYQQALLEAQNS